MPNEDEAWKLTERESIPDVVHRVNQFLQRLICRAETNIVVVSHGVWIECCLRVRLVFTKWHAHGNGVHRLDFATSPEHCTMKASAGS
jgi:broad specificity phosphatase PhoE